MKKVELYSADCGICNSAMEMLNSLSGSHEITVRDMQDSTVAKRAISMGINAVPAIVIDGKLADCCRSQGIDQNVIMQSF